MMMSGTTSSNLNVNVNIFTAAQWEELEQQALIYKYMVSGVPVPSDLILSVRRSLYNSTFSSSSSLSNHQHNLGIREGSYQLYHQLAAGGVGGYGRKIDLEPGRCRRTDGKKWRCAKEAYPDSKYCERHMHRGRNRSRKPVEFSNSSSVSVSSVSSTTINVSSSPSISISKSIDTTFPSFPSISISKSIDTTFPSFPSIQTNLHDYRYLQGMKELGEDFHHQNYSHFNFENLKNHQQSKNEETQGGQHCFVMGTDFIKSSSEESNIQTDTKPFHHFFAPPKTTPNPSPGSTWVEVDHLINPPKSPLSTQDLFQSKPRPYW